MHLLSSDSFSSLIFFLLLFSSLTLTTIIVRSLTFTLPSARERHKQGYIHPAFFRDCRHIGEEHPRQLTLAVWQGPGNGHFARLFCQWSSAESNMLACWFAVRFLMLYQQGGECNQPHAAMGSYQQCLLFIVTIQCWDGWCTAQQPRPPPKALVILVFQQLTFWVSPFLPCVCEQNKEKGPLLDVDFLQEAMSPYMGLSFDIETDFVVQSLALLDWQHKEFFIVFPWFFHGFHRFLSELFDGPCSCRTSHGTEISRPAGAPGIWTDPSSELGFNRVGVAHLTAQIEDKVTGLVLEKSVLSLFSWWKLLAVNPKIGIQRERFQLKWCNVASSIPLPVWATMN